MSKQGYLRHYRFQSNLIIKFSYILEVCELDNYIRELKLKPQFYDKKLFDPHIIEGAQELIG